MTRLIYRGHIFEVTPSVQPYRKPHALNWRFHAPGETYDSVPGPTYSGSTSGVVNWRFQAKYNG